MKPYAATGAHYRRCYSRRGFLKMGAATAAAAVLAHGGADTAFDAWHTDTVRSTASDRIAHVFKELGERYWFLVWAAFALFDGFLASNAVTRWGRRNSEAMVVGLPSLWTIQRVMGAGRPTDPNGDPRYRPFSDDNSASGHAFIAAIPLLTLARTVSGPWRRWAARVAALPTGWSRLNDRKHYLSQVLLGYYLAWHAVETVDAVGRDAD